VLPKLQLPSPSPRFEYRVTQAFFLRKSTLFQPCGTHSPPLLDQILLSPFEAILCVLSCLKIPRQARSPISYKPIRYPGKIFNSSPSLIGEVATLASHSGSIYSFFYVYFYNHQRKSSKSMGPDQIVHHRTNNSTNNAITSGRIIL
jgi:hypothetical protein